ELFRVTSVIVPAMREYEKISELSCGNFVGEFVRLLADRPTILIELRVPERKSRDVADHGYPSPVRVKSGRALEPKMAHVFPGTVTQIAGTRARRSEWRA